MTEKSPLRGVPVRWVLVYTIALLSIWYGSNFLMRNPQYLPSEPLVTKKIEFGKIFALKKKPKSFLYVGQTVEDVREILGDPSGMMTITNRTILMYNGSFLEFMDGCLVTTDTNLLAEVKRVKRTRQETTPRKKR